MAGSHRLRQRAGTALAAPLVLLLAACASDIPAPAPLILKGPDEAMPAPAPIAAGAGPGAGHRVGVRSGPSQRSLAQGRRIAGAATVAGRQPPEIIPLEAGPPRAARPAAREPAAASAAGETPPVASRSPPAVPPAKTAAAKPAAPPPTEAAPPADAAAPHEAHFPWPVHGRLLAGYGVAPGGAHNDGINIAAPRGAPIAAVAGGTVAYAGNELRGYGNLVLVKHPNGWISAYAHCDDVLVKRGDKVGAGQIIAKVGATGGVGEPQLHFELRRGQRPVDPREFLAPAPSAAVAPPAHRG